MSAHDAAIDQQLESGSLPEKYKMAIAAGVAARYPTHNITSVKVGKPKGAIMGAAQYVEISIKAEPTSALSGKVNECVQMSFYEGKPAQLLPGGFGQCRKGMEDITAYVRQAG